MAAACLAASGFAAPPAGAAGFVQQGELTAPDGAASSMLGESVAVSGDTIAAQGYHPSEVSVFVKSPSGWAHATEVAKLTDKGGATLVPYSVAISGDTIVAGVEYKPSVLGDWQGAVDVWVKPAAGWSDATQTAQLTASDAAASDLLGDSVAISASGDTIAASAPLRGSKIQGAAYVWTKPAAGWGSATQAAELTASDGGKFDFLGNGLNGIAVSDDTVATASYAHTVGSNATQGAAYVFSKPAGAWVNATQTAELTAADGAAGDELGSVALSGENAVVAGAPRHRVAGNSQQGAAYVFAKGAGSWAHATQAAELTSADGGAGDKFGLAVAATPNTIAIGAPYHQVGANAGQGALYVFTESPAGWAGASQSGELTAGDGAGNDNLGSVGIDGATIAGGAVGHQVGSNAGQGALYVFAQPLQPPTNRRLPAITGSPMPAGTLTCQPGQWSNQPTAFVYQWYRDAKPVSGATHPAYVVQFTDEAHALSCTVTASNPGGAGAPARSQAVFVGSKSELHCPKPSGSLSATKLGPLALGMTRTQARHLLRRFHVGPFKFDDFCLYAGWGIRVTYPNPALRRAFPSAGRYDNRIIWALTANPFYSLNGVLPGARISAVAKRLRAEAPFTIGVNTWYLIPGKQATGILKVRHGLIYEIGIAVKSLTGPSRKTQRAFLRALE